MSWIRREELAMRIREVIRGKGDRVVTVAPDATVRDLLALLAEHNVGALVVSADGSSVSGIVSERDVVRRLHDADTGLLDQKVSAIMTTEVRTVEPEEHVDDLMRLMTDHRIRHVPVLVDGRLAGIVSIGDVVKQRLGELEDERDQLSRYISSGP
jgi:CBS domain-containing protein